jgi:hypothetical protein
MAFFSNLLSRDRGYTGYDFESLDPSTRERTASRQSDRQRGQIFGGQG